MILGPSESTADLAYLALLIISKLSNVIVEQTSYQRLKYSLINFHLNFGKKSELVGSIATGFSKIKLARYLFNKFSYVSVSLFLICLMNVMEVYNCKSGYSLIMLINFILFI